MREQTRKFKLRTPVAKKERIEQTTENKGGRKQLGSSKLKLGQNFTVAKTCLSRLNGKRISRRNSRRLNRLIPINERKVILKRKTDRKSRSGIIAEIPRKRKTDEQANDRAFAICKKMKTVR